MRTSRIDRPVALNENEIESRKELIDKIRLLNKKGFKAGA
jgi:DNA polymerase sigma